MRVSEAVFFFKNNTKSKGISEYKISSESPKCQIWIIMQFGLIDGSETKICISRKGHLTRTLDPISQSQNLSQLLLYNTKCSIFPFLNFLKAYMHRKLKIFQGT